MTVQPAAWRTFVDKLHKVTLQNRINLPEEELTLRLFQRLAR
jgi:hypothetical protein